MEDEEDRLEINIDIDDELTFSWKRMWASLCLENRSCLKCHALFEFSGNGLWAFVISAFSQIHVWHIFIFEERNSGLSMSILKANNL